MNNNYFVLDYFLVSIAAMDKTINYLNLILHKKACSMLRKSGKVFQEK